MTSIILKPNFFILFALLAAFAVPPLAHAQAPYSMDNTKAMDAALAKVEQAYKSNPKKGPAAVQQLAESQKKWKISTGKKCKAAQAKFMECMDKEVLARTQALNALAVAP